MAQEKFEGDLDQISSRQLEYIAEVLDKRGFNDAKATLEAVGEAGDNYMSNVKRVTAEKDGETLKIIVKIASKIEQVRISMNTRIFFQNEHTMYTEVLPKFTELEIAVGVPEEERLKYATCYGTLMEDYEELILLEDLGVSDYTMLDRFKSLTDNDVKLILKSFAKLHSLSYALKHQEPDTYNSFVRNLKDIWKVASEDENMEKQIALYFQTIEDDCIRICEQSYKDFIEGTSSKILELTKALGSFDGKSRFSVIQQGDSWTNNILFKLQEGKSVSCCMIDYQLSRVNSPAADLHYMLFNCTDHETRKEYFPEWIDYYHSELKKRLVQFDLNIDEIYPRDQLDADLKRHTKMSVATTIQLGSVLCREKDAAQDFKNAFENVNIEENIDDIIEATKASNLDKKAVSVYKSRVEGAIQTCILFGLL